MITAEGMTGLLLAGSIVVIGIAHVFEEVFGYLPCALCLKQRIAYYAAIGLSMLALGMLTAGRRGFAGVLLGLVAIGYLINTGLGLYHAGVEWHWWQGPAECSAAAPLTTDAASLIESLQTTHRPRCDEAPWRFMFLSFAGWSAVASGAMAWLAARAGLEASRSA